MTIAQSLTQASTRSRPPISLTNSSLTNAPVKGPQRSPNSGNPSFQAVVPVTEAAQLLNGKILTETHSHTAWGSAVAARMYLRQPRQNLWSQLTDYRRWVEYFPDMVQSEVLERGVGETRLYQAAKRDFLMLSVQVEVYLRVQERVRPDRSHQLQFHLEKGSFTDFSANLLLEDWQDGTLLTYTVRATPHIPVPSLLLQQAMRLDLPANMQRMRNVLCAL